MLGTRLGLLFALIVLFVLGSIGTAGSVAAHAVASFDAVAAAVDDCDTARDLVEDDRPVAALQLIRDVREALVKAAGSDELAETAARNYCNAQFFAALRGICSQAQGFVDATKATEAIELIDAVRASAVATVAAGDAAYSERRAAIACSAPYADAVAMKKETSGAEDLGTRWATLVAEWITPVAPLGGWILGLIAVVIVLSRVLVALIGMPPMPPPNQVGLKLLGAVVLVPVGAVLVVFGLTGLGLAWPAPLTISLGAVATFGGLFLLTFFVGGRLRVSLDYLVGGTSDKVAGGRVIAEMMELGGGRLQGVEIPVTTDIKVLDGEPISTGVTNDLLKAVLTALAAIFATVPWTIQVIEVPGKPVPGDKPGEEKKGPATEHIVSVSRNGRTEFAEVVSTAQLRPSGLVSTEPLKPDLFVAAAILGVIATAYRRGFGTLGRGRDWKSLGLAVAATRDFRSNEGDALKLAAAALDRDPQNDLAERSYMFYRYRHKLGIPGSVRYAEWMKGRLDDERWTVGLSREDARGARLGMLTNYVSVVRNLLAEAKAAEQVDPDASAPKGFLWRLLRWLVARWTGSRVATPVPSTGRDTAPRTAPVEAGTPRQEALDRMAVSAMAANNEILDALRRDQRSLVPNEMRLRAAIAARVLAKGRSGLEGMPKAAWSEKLLNKAILAAERSSSGSLAYSTLCLWGSTGVADAGNPPKPDAAAEPVVWSETGIARTRGWWQEVFGRRRTSALPATKETLTADQFTATVRAIFDSGFQADWIERDPELRSVRNNPLYKDLRTGATQLASGA